MDGAASAENAANGPLNTLFNRLRTQASQQSNAESNAATQAAHPVDSQRFREASNGSPVQISSTVRNYHAPMVSSPIPTPPIHGPQPHHSAVMSPNVPSPQMFPQAPSGGLSDLERTNNLLNLLKFRQPGQTTGGEQGQLSGRPNGQEATSRGATPQTTHDRSISASDLVASLIGKSSTPNSENVHERAGTGVRSPHPPETAHSSSASENPQDFLLKLLSRPKPSIAGRDAPHKSSTGKSPDVSSVENVTGEKGTQVADTEPTRAEEETKLPAPAPVPAGGISKNSLASSGSNGQFALKPGMFTYVNPFEQLAASSPRNRTPRAETPRSRPDTPNVEILRRSHEVDQVSDSGPLRKQDKGLSSETRGSSTGSMGNGNTSSRVASNSSQRGGVTRASTQSPIGTVAEALTQVAAKVDKQVEEALSKAEEEDKARNDSDSRSLDKNAHAAFPSFKQEPVKLAQHAAVKEGHPQSVTGVLKDNERAAEGNVADSWESADGEESTGDGPEQVVRVYNFPIKPFVAITIQHAVADPANFTDDSILEIARLKKEFDQADRSLMDATSEYIVYAMAKNGGLRIIRQDDGRDRQIFRFTQDRIFNESVGHYASDKSTTGVQTILATGLSGSVYWAKITDPYADLFEANNIESNGFVFPPTPPNDDNTSGGRLKTRAKLSSRHPDYFAVGRGKAIHIIWVERLRDFVVDANTRLVDGEKYLAQKSLKVVTGKAGKDFTFSRDDSMIVSLDKSGRLKFWDIRSLVAETNGLPGNDMALEVSAPLLTLVTSSPSEKSWPTSVHFVDKSRPYAKAIALRYLLVGFKQNHTLQLWDLALEKPVQELNFPHDNESDGVCSVAYHAPTGIIVVGHPTKNRIYFVHLSAPKYNLPPMTQSNYVQRLAQKDASLPKPEATAIMSGLREFSFAAKGDLRSLELLSEPFAQPEDADDPVLFELYVMHSRGATCLKIRKADLGWDNDNKVLHPVSAEKEALISVRDLQEPVQTPVTESLPPAALNGLETGDTAKPSTPIPGDTSMQEVNDVVKTGSDKAEKRKKKRASIKEDPASSTQTLSYVPASAVINAQVSESLSNNEPSSGKEALPKGSAAAEPINLGVPSDLLNKEVEKIEKIISAEFSRVFNVELERLYRRIDDDRRVQEAAGAAKQDAVLRLVSSTLSENVEKSLAHIVNLNIQQKVLPVLSESTSSTLGSKLPELIQQHVQRSMASNLKLMLPDAINRAMQKPDILAGLSETLATRMTAGLREELSALMRSTLLPTMTDLATQTAQRMGTQLERRIVEEIKASNVQRRQDSVKLDELTSVIRGLLETVRTMDSQQADLRKEIAALRQGISQSRQSPGEQRVEAQVTAGGHRESASPPPKAQEDEEIETITRLMNEGRYEEGTILWLQSSRQNELFDRYFSRIRPGYLSTLSPLVALSVAAAVSGAFQDHVNERLGWLETVFATLNPTDPDIQEVVGKILEVLIQRLESLYAAVAEGNRDQVLLHHIHSLARKAKELKLLVS